MAKKIKITECVLRDAHQSLIATRMTLDEMLPILPAMDEVGYYSLECWGGATFDSCIRFLDEDPWERLRTIRKECPKTNLQMLFRGQNMLGYRPYADDAVEYFVQKSVANGINILRIFDALNDPRNLETAIRASGVEKEEDAKAAFIENTNALARIAVSEPVYEAMKGREDITCLGGPFTLTFDGAGNLKTNWLGEEIKE